MEEQFRELYKLLFSQDGNAINTATEQLTAFYQNPQSIFSLINLLNPSEPLELRKHAGIGLKQTLQHCWEIVITTENLPIIKANMIQLLSREQDYTMRHIILDAMIPIFSTECENWPELFNYIGTLSTATDEQSIELFLSLLTCIIRSLQIGFVAPLFDNLLGKAKFALSTNSFQVVLAGANLLQSIFTLVATDPEIMVNIIMEMISVFYNLLKANSPYSGQIMNSICSIVNECDNFFGSIQPVLERYYVIVNDNEIPPESRTICSELLCTLIDHYPGEIEQHLSQIIAMTLELASLTVFDDCFENQTDLLYAVRPIEQLSRAISPDLFFSSFLSAVQTDQPNKLVAVSTSFVSFIENIPDVVSMNFSDIFDIALGCVQNPVHFVQESGFSMIYQLVSRHYSMFADLFDKLMGVVLPALNQNGHEPLICKVLSLMDELLFFVEVPDAFIEPLLASFISLVPKISPLNTYLVINAISNLIYSAQDNIMQQQASSELIPILQGAISHDPSQQPLIVAAGIEALSYLISFAPSETQPIHGFMLEKIHQYLQFEDTSLFSSVMISLSAILKSAAVNFIDHINHEILFGSIMKVLQIEFENLDKETAVYSSIIEAKEKALSFLSILSRAKPDFVLPVVSDLAHLVINHFNSVEEDYHELKAALKATISVSQLLSKLENREFFSMFIKKMMDILIENFEARKLETASLSFYGFTQLISLKLPLEESIIKIVVNSGFMFMEDRLNCQQDDENNEFNEFDDERYEICEIDSRRNIELSDEVFGFFAILAQNLPGQFPFEDFSNFAQKLYEKWKKGELDYSKINVFIECVGVLCELYAVSVESFPSLFLIAYHQWIFDSLSLCLEFEYPPHPLVAARCYIEMNNSIKPEELNQILSVATAAFSSEFDEQTYYSNTIADVISILFTIIKIVVSAQKEGRETVNFEYLKFLPNMLALLPMNICQSEADNIVFSLVFCARSIPGFVENCGGEVLRILSQIIGMKKKKLAKLKISNNTLNMAIVLLREISASLPNANELIGQWLNKFSIVRFQERVSQ